MAAPQKRWNVEIGEESSASREASPETIDAKIESEDPELQETPNSKMDGQTRSEDLLDEPDEDLDAALRTGLYVVTQEPDQAEAEAKTEEFDDTDTADKAKSDEEKADPDDRKNSP